MRPEQINPSPSDSAWGVQDDRPRLDNYSRNQMNSASYPSFISVGAYLIKEAG